ncbi:hypothetical protein C8F04DRAFT_1174205 [Mycena alexandri]|uniref:Uncharacterized protein n=1 Tax=Mycena alexandri TaxID=1745969 RepID=A0AAD6TET7_9AGAR|nr:hypothetical protein C8F04DRAFT_1174205 [Mycena alexandri]
MELDCHYDKSGAVEALDEVIQGGLAYVAAKEDAAIQHLSAVDLDRLIVKQNSTNNKMWHLMSTTPDGSPDCEVVFRVQGILAAVDLVANHKFTKCKPDRAAGLSQRVKLIGLDSPLFQNALRQTLLVHSAFERHFGRSVNSWNVGGETADGYISLSSNYFTRSTPSAAAERHEPADGVDPFGVLQHFEKIGLVHTKENVVKYFRKYMSKDGVAEIYGAFPGNFRVGDIVEARGSVTVVSAKNSTLKVHYHLHSVILHDARFSKIAEDLRAKVVRRAIVPSVLVRKGEFIDEDEDVGQTRKRLKELAVTDDDSVMTH